MLVYMEKFHRFFTHPEIKLAWRIAIPLLLFVQIAAAAFSLYAGRYGPHTWVFQYVPYIFFAFGGLMFLLPKIKVSWLPMDTRIQQINVALGALSVLLGILALFQLYQLC